MAASAASMPELSLRAGRVVIAETGLLEDAPPKIVSAGVNKGWVARRGRVEVRVEVVLVCTAKPLRIAGLSGSTEALSS